MKKHKLLSSVAVAVVQIVAVTYWFEHTLLVVGILSLSTVFLWWQFSFSKVALAMFIILALSGFIAEAVVVTQGAWVYQSQHFLGLPVWLPLLWGSVGIATIQLVEKLQQRYGTK